MPVKDWMTTDPITINPDTSVMKASQVMKENNIPTDALESSKKKVLIVDDDEGLVELMVDAFERDTELECQFAGF